jgi:perosamine synthetase
VTSNRAIPVFRPSYDEREEQAIVNVLRSGWIGLGPMTERFETRFAAHVGAKYGVAMNSATAALHVALRLLNVGRGDEVLVPTMTFVSSAMVADYEGASPVFCDVEPRHLLMDYADAAERRTLRTRAVIPVLYGGRPIDPPDLGVPVIYDCAHAVGARWDAAGKLCCWSFQAVKNLATGDGGMITLNDRELYERALRLRWLGIDKSTWDRSGVAERYWWEYSIEQTGFKYHMNDITAALGLVQLEKLPEMQQKRHRLVKQYLDELAGVPDLELPEYDPGSAWHLFAIRTPLRNELSLHLQAAGVSTGVHYKPVHLYPLYRKYSLPVAEREWVRLLTLPLFPDLTSAQVSFICDNVRAGLVSLRKRQSQVHETPSTRDE